MDNLDSLTPTQNERLTAGVSHLFILIPFLGFLVPRIIWVTQKDKSQYVAFQSFQAFIYQVIVFAIWLIGIAISYVLPIFGIWFVAPIINLIVRFALAAYGIFGAVMAFQGKPFRYWLISDRIEHQLSTIANKQWLVQFRELQKRPTFPIIVGFGVACIHSLITPFLFGSSFSSARYVLGLILAAPGFIPIFAFDSFLSSATKFIDPSILEIIFFLVTRQFYK